jgi:hypothetical protein
MNWPSLIERVPVAPAKYAAKLGRSLRVIQSQFRGAEKGSSSACRGFESLLRHHERPANKMVLWFCGVQRVTYRRRLNTGPYTPV